MDNEAFRYLAAVKHGIKYEEDEDEIFGASWKKAKLVLSSIDKSASHLSY